MADPHRTTRFPFWLWLIRAIGVIVPRRLRSDWREEWEAELQHREALLADWHRLNWRTKLDLLRRSLGAFRDALWMQTYRWEDEMIQDLRFGLRMLAKNPGFTFVAILTLALGIGANTTIFSVVNAVLLRPLPYPDSEKLLEVGRVFKSTDDVGAFSEPKFVFLRDNGQFFEAVAATIGWDVYLSDENQTEYIRGMRVTADFFRALDVPPASGRGFTAEEDSPAGERVVILSDGLWRRRFGADPAILGKTISLNDVPHTVVGIMPPGFEYYGPRDVFVPMRVNPASQNEGHNWTVIARLKRGVTMDQARAELELVFDKFRTAHPRWVFEDETFGLMSWRASMTGEVQGLLWILLGVAGLVLLIACANVANLQLARAAARQKEMAIRMAVGAGGGRLLRQLLTEGMALALLGGGLGLLLALWGMKAIPALVPPGMLPRADEIDPDWNVLTFALGASLLTGIAFSLAPALQALRVDVNRTLKEGGGKAGAGVSRGHLRGALVVTEVGLALMLTIGAGLLLRTFANLRGIEPGFEASGVLTFEVAPRIKNYDTMAKLNDLYGRALERLRSLPGVEAAALTNRLPLDRWYNLPYRLPGQSDWAGAVEYRMISPDYFQVMKMALRKGRTFDESDKAGAEPVAIVNEAFARRNFADVDPLGQQFCVLCEGGAPMLRVVGVVNETKQRSLSETAPPTVFVPVAQVPENVQGAARQVSFALRTAGDPMLLARAIENEMRQIDPTVSIRNLSPLEELVDRSIAPQRFNLSLLGLFAGLGLVLAAVGIYGVMAYSVGQRTHEIGIRLALGASPLDVLRLIVRQGMTLALTGVALGLLGAAALTRLLKGLLYGVSANDPLTFFAVALLLSCVALVGCYLPARQATKVDPMVALRNE